MLAHFLLYSASILSTSCLCRRTSGLDKPEQSGAAFRYLFYSGVRLIVKSARTLSTQISRTYLQWECSSGRERARETKRKREREREGWREDNGKGGGEEDGEEEGKGVRDGQGGGRESEGEM